MALGRWAKKTNNNNVQHLLHFQKCIYEDSDDARTSRAASLDSFWFVLDGGPRATERIDFSLPSGRTFSSPAIKFLNSASLSGQAHRPLRQQRVQAHMQKCSWRSSSAGKNVITKMKFHSTSSDAKIPNTWILRMGENAVTMNDTKVVVEVANIAVAAVLNEWPSRALGSYCLPNMRRHRKYVRTLFFSLLFRTKTRPFTKRNSPFIPNVMQWNEPAGSPS